MCTKICRGFSREVALKRGSAFFVYRNIYVRISHHVVFGQQCVRAACSYERSPTSHETRRREVQRCGAKLGFNITGLEYEVSKLWCFEFGCRCCHDHASVAVIVSLVHRTCPVLSTLWNNVWYVWVGVSGGSRLTTCFCCQRVFGVLNTPCKDTLGIVVAFVCNAAEYPRQVRGVHLVQICPPRYVLSKQPGMHLGCG